MGEDFSEIISWLYIGTVRQQNAGILGRNSYWEIVIMTERV